MTRWSPQTCACVFELDGMNNWQETIHKCDLHKELEFTGKRLLEEVKRHNKEHSPRTEPDTIEGILGFDFEPDWLIQIRKYPSTEKLQESKFNLEMLKGYYPISREFQYFLSNFIIDCVMVSSEGV